jgi:uncharacterized coiled-coil protein SlyX
MSNQELEIPPSATMEEKIDLILFYLADISKKQGIIVKLEEKITVLESKTASQEATISSLCKEVRMLKESNNDRDQASRGLTLRLFGLPLTKDEQDGTKTTSSVAYDRILKPVLSAAKTKGIITSIPQLPTLVSECYRARRSGSGPPESASAPPIIIKFINPLHRLALLRCKKDNTPSPSDSERAAGFKRFVMVEDLTPANHTMLKDLQNDDRVSKVWSVDGRIRFVLSGDDQSVKKVKSVFDSPESAITAAMKKSK